MCPSLCAQEDEKQVVQTDVPSPRIGDERVDNVVAEPTVFPVLRVALHQNALGKDCAAARRICKQLASEGIGMLRFDNLGLGDSEGDWGDGSFSHKLATPRRRRAVTSNDSGREVRLLVGHSFSVGRRSSARPTRLIRCERW